MTLEITMPFWGREDHLRLAVESVLVLERSGRTLRFIELDPAAEVVRGRPFDLRLRRFRSPLNLKRAVESGRGFDCFVVLLRFEDTPLGRARKLNFGFGLGDLQ